MNPFSNSTNHFLEKTINSLSFCLDGRNDVFVTTSFGYQSSLLFHILREFDISIKCFSIISPLSYGGIDEQKDYILNKYDIDLTEEDRTAWLNEQLEGRDFMMLEEEERRSICREMKRKPLIDFIKKNKFEIWISGIRRDQNENRKDIKFIEATDLDVLKISPLFSWTISDVREIMKASNLRTNDDYVDLCKLNSKMECGLHI